MILYLTTKWQSLKATEHGKTCEFIEKLVKNALTTNGVVDNVAIDTDYDGENKKYNKETAYVTTSRSNKYSFKLFIPYLNFQYSLENELYLYTMVCHECSHIIYKDPLYLKKEMFNPKFITKYKEAMFYNVFAETRADLFAKRYLPKLIDMYEKQLDTGYYGKDGNAARTRRLTMIKSNPLFAFDWANCDADDTSNPLVYGYLPVDKRFWVITNMHNYNRDVQKDILMFLLSNGYVDMINKCASMNKENEWRDKLISKSLLREVQIRTQI